MRYRSKYIKQSPNTSHSISCLEIGNIRGEENVVFFFALLNERTTYKVKITFVLNTNRANNFSGELEVCPCSPGGTFDQFILDR